MGDVLGSSLRYVVLDMLTLASDNDILTHLNLDVCFIHNNIASVSDGYHIDIASESLLS